MDLRQLESFVEVVKQKSFTRAAEILFLTQPTVTGHIQSLENELTTILFNRQGKNITLTEAGRILYNHAVNILNMKEQTYYAMNQYKGAWEGELAIAASTVPQRCLLPGLLVAFSKKYPAISYSIKHFDSKGVIDVILAGNIDFGFVGTSLDYPELEMLKLCEDTIIVVAPNNGKYKNMESNVLSWEDIKGEKLILREEGSATREQFIRSLEKQNKSLEELNVIASIESHDTIKKCVQEGLGISIVSKKMAQEEIDLGLLKGFILAHFDFTRDFYFINHKRRVLNPIARIFREFTQEYFAPKL